MHTCAVSQASIFFSTAMLQSIHYPLMMRFQICKSSVGGKEGRYDKAVRTTRFLNEGQPTLSCFEFDEEDAVKKGLNIKRFYDYSEEWAEFIVMNRKNSSETQAHSYDIVIGPIADDTVGVQIRRYIMGYMSASVLVEELKFRGDHAIQYFFGTPEAVECLKRI